MISRPIESCRPYLRSTFSPTTGACLLADAEVAADGERLLLDLGLEFDFGLVLDFRLTRAC